MSGSSFEIAIATIEAILDTLSDNDYVNLIVFSDVTRSAVPCFKDKMVSNETLSLFRLLCNLYNETKVRSCTDE